MNFVESSIKCSSEELIMSLAQCHSDLSAIAREAADSLEGAGVGLSEQLKHQISVVGSIKNQFSDFLNRTNYLHSYATLKQ